MRAMSGLRDLVQRSLGSKGDDVEDDYDFEVDLSRLMPREPPTSSEQRGELPHLRERLIDTDSG